MTKAKAPEHLSKVGRKLWTEILSKYDLRVDELVTLEDYCAMADEIDELRREHAELGKPRMTKGSMGQLVDHPIPKRITTLQVKRAALAKQLNLPDDTAAAAGNQQRAAAQSRWAQAHGAGA